MPRKPLTLGEWADRRVCWLLSGVYDSLAREFAQQRELWRWSKGWRSSTRPAGQNDARARPSEEDLPPE